MKKITLLVLSCCLLLTGCKGKNIEDVVGNTPEVNNVVLLPPPSAEQEIETTVESTVESIVERTGKISSSLSIEDITLQLPNAFMVGISSPSSIPVYYTYDTDNGIIASKAGNYYLMLNGENFYANVGSDWYECKDYSQSLSEYYKEHNIRKEIVELVKTHSYPILKNNGEYIKYADLDIIEVTDDTNGNKVILGVNKDNPEYLYYITTSDNKVVKIQAINVNTKLLFEYSFNNLDLRKVNEEDIIMISEDTLREMRDVVKDTYNLIIADTTPRIEYECAMFGDKQYAEFHLRNGWNQGVKNMSTFEEFESTLLNVYGLMRVSYSCSGATPRYTYTYVADEYNEEIWDDSILIQIASQLADNHMDTVEIQKNTNVCELNLFKDCEHKYINGKYVKSIMSESTARKIPLAFVVKTNALKNLGEEYENIGIGFGAILTSDGRYPDGENEGYFMLADSQPLHRNGQKYPTVDDRLIFDDIKSINIVDISTALFNESGYWGHVCTYEDKVYGEVPSATVSDDVFLNEHSPAYIDDNSMFEMDTIRNSDGTTGAIFKEVELVIQPPKIVHDNQDDCIIKPEATADNSLPYLSSSNGIYPFEQYTYKMMCDLSDVILSKHPNITSSDTANIMLTAEGKFISLLKDANVDFMIDAETYSTSSSILYTKILPEESDGFQELNNGVYVSQASNGTLSYRIYLDGADLGIIDVKPNNEWYVLNIVITPCKKGDKVLN